MTREREKIGSASFPPPFTDHFPPLKEPDLPPGFSSRQLPGSKLPAGVLTGYKNSLLKDGSEGREFDLAQEWELESGDVVVDKSHQIPNVTISARAHGLLAEKMKSTAILRPIGGKIGYKNLLFQILKIWKPTKKFHLVELITNCFMVRFESEEDYLKALTQGPWLIFGFYLTVQPWTPEFSPESVGVSSLVAWIRLPQLPIHFYHPGVLKAIAESIGPVYKMDQVTSSFDRAKYARFAVGLDLTNPLLPYIYIDGKKQKIEYEGLPKICYKCGSVGHVQSLCPSVEEIAALCNPEEEGMEVEAAMEDPPPLRQSQKEGGSPTGTLPLIPSVPKKWANNNEKSPFGPWLQVTRPPKRSFPEPELSNVQPSNNKKGKDPERSGSRFEVLADEEVEHDRMDSFNPHGSKEMIQEGRRKHPKLNGAFIPTNCEVDKYGSNTVINSNDGTQGAGTRTTKGKASGVRKKRQPLGSINSNTVLDPSRHTVAVILDDEIHYSTPCPLIGSSSKSTDSNKENISCHSYGPVKDTRKGIRLSKNLHKTLKVKNPKNIPSSQLTEKAKNAILCSLSNVEAPSLETELSHSETSMDLCEHDGTD